jgi:endonuclease YncB( thermonuclease family)
VDGVDTPEKDFRAKCPSEDNLAHNASKFTSEKIQHAKSYIVVIKGEDKYFRLLGDIIIDGEKLSELLIKNNLAREYHGEKKKSWCDIF